MRKPKNKISLETAIKELDQYDLFDADLIFSRHKNYSAPIGMLLISFSRLEYFLNYMIARSINDRSDEPGLRVIKYLEFKDKINLASDLYIRLINSISNSTIKNQKRDKLKIIINKLIEISEFRNKIAHANWMTLDKEGFVRVDIREDKSGGGVVFKSIKITPLIIRKFIRQTDSLVKIINNFIESIGKALK